MNKYEARANALISRIESMLRAIKECQARDEPAFISIPVIDNNATYSDTLLDIQLLFYCYDPQIPLYAEALALNKRVAEVNAGKGDIARYKDFQTLQYLLGKFLNVLAFRQQP